MNYDDLKELDDSELRYDITHFSEHDGICTLNGMIPIQVDAVSFSYEGCCVRYYVKYLVGEYSET
ncbi:MAG: hypothetical protein ACKPEO_23565 [Sphaerospermopsis kisseleviana]